MVNNVNGTYSGGAKNKIQGGSGGNGGGRGNQKNNRWSKIVCHNCGKLGHVPGSYNDGYHDGKNNTADAIRRATLIYAVCPDGTNRATIPWETDRRSSGVDNAESGEATSAPSIKHTTVSMGIPVVLRQTQRAIIQRL